MILFFFISTAVILGWVAIWDSAALGIPPLSRRTKLIIGSTIAAVVLIVAANIWWDTDLMVGQIQGRATPIIAKIEALKVNGKYPETLPKELQRELDRCRLAGRYSPNSESNDADFFIEFGYYHKDGFSVQYWSARGWTVDR